MSLKQELIETELSILTENVLHNQDFTEELRKAKQVAKYSLAHKKCRNSADVKHLGLPSEVSNQILRKYGSDPKAKRVPLILPGRAVKRDGNHLWIPCLKLTLPFALENVVKINQIEIDKEYAHIAYSIQDAELIEENGFIGVDCNATGHTAVIANPETGKVAKLNKRESRLYKGRNSDTQHNIYGLVVGAKEVYISDGSHRGFVGFRSQEMQILTLDINSEDCDDLILPGKENILATTDKKATMKFASDFINKYKDILYNDTSIISPGFLREPEIWTNIQLKLSQVRLDQIRAKREKPWIKRLFTIDV